MAIKGDASALAPYLAEHFVLHTKAHDRQGKSKAADDGNSMLEAAKAIPDLGWPTAPRRWTRSAGPIRAWCSWTYGCRGIDGWDFARLYRERATPPAPLVVMIAARDALALGREVGADAVLTKPFDIGELDELLDRYCR